MENLSHSRPKKSYHNNGFPTKTVYDDVFGAPPKFGVSTLSPRLEDYTEIFEGFHASRGSSIPILDLSAVDSDAGDLFYDVRSSNFDYSEVFGGFNGLEFAVSYEELLKESNGGDDSSDEVWTPAQSESLSDESDPSAFSGKNQSLSSGDLHHSFDGPEQFNISYHKANPKGKEITLPEMTHVTQLDAVPGYSFIVDETPTAQKIDDEHSHLHLNHNTAFVGGVTEGKRFRKTLSQPANREFGIQEYESECSPFSGHDKVGSSQKAFISVSDFSLRTQPSNLPPPSRPPPAFADRKGSSSKLNSKLKASKSYAFERMEADSSPPYFDVEIDASSSAAASAAAMKDAVEKAQAQLRNAKELMERKKEGLQSRTKLHLENDVEHQNKKPREFDTFNSLKDERLQSTCEREEDGVKTYTVERRKKGTNTAHVSGAIDGEDHFNVAGISAFIDHGKDHTSSRGSHETEGTVAWREATQFYEVVEKKRVKDEKTAARVDHVREETGEQFDVLKGASEQIEDRGRRKATKGLTRQEGLQEKPNVAQMGSEWQDMEKKTRLGPQLGVTEKRLNEHDKCEQVEILIEEQLRENELVSEHKLKGVNERVEYDKRIKEIHGREIKETFDSKEYEREIKEDLVRVGNMRKVKESVELGTTEKREKEVCESEKTGQKEEKVLEIGKDMKKLEEDLESEGKMKRSKKVIELQKSRNRLKLNLKKQENSEEQKMACEAELNERDSKGTLEQEKNAKIKGKAYEGEETEKRLNDDCEIDENEKRLDEAWEHEENKKQSREAPEGEKGAELLFEEEGTEDRSKGSSEREECEKEIKDDCNYEGFNGQKSVDEKIKEEENDRKLNLNHGVYASTEGRKESDGVCSHSQNETPQATRVAGHNNIHGSIDSQKVPLCEENERLKESKIRKREMETVEGENEPIEEGLNSSNRAKSNEYGTDIGGLHIEKSRGVSEVPFTTENANISTHKHRGRENINEVQISFDQEEDKNRSQVVREWVEQGRKLGDVLPTQKFASQNTERKEPNLNKKFTSEVGEIEDRLKRERDLENDRLRKIEEEREREREREKDRMAVDTATREARERTFAEARDRAERAAVEKATAEVRQRALAEARERLEKASAEARERLIAGKASTEARLKAERAAVERATAEARERAFEKTMADKASLAARERVDRSVADKFSVYSRNSELRQSASSSNLQYQSVGSSRDLKYSYSSSGLEVESVQRCKARLERHQRTAERAAKALAEKNMRDLLAYKEQAERNRLAESLDADVKRWSSGKEGNLRALLSTLQYILGSDSGWQPIPLTDVITAVAVKKAYRKATLCVHPDKLQQRGASIQQKYICEKVFDLLKEAWNKFNSEER